LKTPLVSRPRSKHTKRNIISQNIISGGSGDRQSGD
jgi:hypothetical protein